MELMEKAADDFFSRNWRRAPVSSRFSFHASSVYDVADGQPSLVVRDYPEVTSTARGFPSAWLTRADGKYMIDRANWSSEAVPDHINDMAFSVD
ncbi:hypothetical protein B0H13DRAFT_2309511 [Mycena leptocephala]|nr:hypothetical protein B0H13DRAFT_2309511 [Mycena leptocephala]